MSNIETAIIAYNKALLDVEKIIKEKSEHAMFSIPYFGKELLQEIEKLSIKYEMKN